MKRRVLLFVVTLVTLALAMWVYRVASRDGVSDPENWNPPKTDPPGKTVRIPGTGGEEASAGDRPELDVYDRDTHRLRARFRAETWNPLGSDRYRVVKPHLEWFLRSGETLLLDAEEGTVRARLIGNAPDVMDGELSGDVRIVLDQSRQPGAVPLEQRPGDAVRIHLEQAHFDRDTLTILSDGNVSVFSADADILGCGLKLSWSEEPRQLREMTIVHGEYMCIRQQQERFMKKGWSLPGAWSGGKSKPPTPPAPPAEAMRAAPVPWIGPPLAAAMAQTTAPSSAATGPAARAPVVKNTYVAVFSQEVRVTSGDQRLEGADELRLVFEMKRPDRESATRPAPSTASPPARPSVPTPRPTTAPASRPAAEAGADEPIVVTWTGPLTIRPFRSRDEYVPDRLDVAARGERLRLFNEDMDARCRELEYTSVGDLARLTGTEADPVRLTMADGTKLRARQVRFDGQSNQMFVDGAGTMEGLAGAKTVVQGGGKEPADDLSATWSRDVQIRLAPHEVVVDGETRTEPCLVEAVFHGDVDVKQGPARTIRAETLTVRFHPPAPGSRDSVPSGLHATGGVKYADKDTGDTIAARELDVQLTTGADGRTWPRSATATGEVVARQGDSDIAADALTVTFAAAPDKQGRVKPVRLDAAGSVKVTDRSGSEPVTASADKLSSDLLERSAVLTGHAKVTHADNDIEGERIVLDEPREAATVAGKGTLSFLATTDITGAKAEKPVLVTVGWADGLEYRGQKRSAVFTGKVEMAAGADRLSCRQLRVLFAPPDEKDEAATTATTATATSTAEKPARRRATFQPKKIAMVLADKDVRLASLTVDAEGYWTRRMTMWSQDGQVVYEAAAQRIACFGPGLLQVEDYRPPDPSNAKRGTDPISAGPDRPSQTAFAWRKSMDLNRKDRTANFVGEVEMSHRTGKDVVLKDKLKTRPWGELTEGRTMKMDCDQMFAEFAPPEDGSATTRPSDPLSGEGVGPLELFRARAAEGGRHIGIRYDTYRIFCRRIVYQRSKDLAILYGHLENEPPANAVIINEDFKRSRFTNIHNSRVLWRPKTDRFEAQGVRVRVSQ